MPENSPLASDTASTDPAVAGRPWYKLLNRYHWFVLMVAAMGWLFDTMDQQLFALARSPAMQELIPASSLSSEATADEIEASEQQLAKARSKAGGDATAIFLLGWASGGLLFGIMGDRFGRARVMLWTILLYSLFTGASAFSRGYFDFCLFRFLTGMGVGGEFAVGVSLVAEVMPAAARPFALGWLQALSAVGNITAAFIAMGLGKLEEFGALSNLTIGGYQLGAWRLMFLVGTLPALLAVLIRAKLKEPERWQAASKAGLTKKTWGLYTELFGDPRWRRNALVGMSLAFAGVFGLWGIGFFSFDLIDSVMQNSYQGSGLSETEIRGRIGFWKGIASMMQNLGGFCGVYAYARITHHIGRRRAFALSFVAAMLSTAFVFWFIDSVDDLFWMLPLMGFCQLAAFGGFAIYFPELFPTRLRSTGTSFCYNVGRFVAASGPYFMGVLTSEVFRASPETMRYRYAGLSMCLIFLIGLAVLPFAPETKDQPLPE